jgi:hypothetical protein
LVLAESHGGLIDKRVNLEMMVKDLNGNLRVDIVNDWNLMTMRIIPVSVMGGEGMLGISFWIDLQEEEILSNTKKRICGIINDIELSKIKFEVRFKKHNEERIADNVVLWDLYEALRQIDIQKLNARRPDGPGIVIRN